MAFQRIAEVQFDWEAVLQTCSRPYLSFCVKLDLSDSFIREVKGSVKIWKMAQAISSRLHLHSVCDKAISSVKFQRFVTLGQSLKDLGNPWGANSTCAFVGTHVKARVPSLQEKCPPHLFSDSVSEAELPGRYFSPVQEWKRLKWDVQGI